MKRFLKYIFITISSLALIILVGAGLLLMQLSRGPVNLDFLKTHLIGKILTHSDTLDFKTLQLVWDNPDAPIRLEGLDISYTQGKEKHREFSIEKIQINFPVQSLMRLNGTPEKITIDGAQFSLHSFKEGAGEKQYKTTLSFKKVNEFLENLLGLKAVHITNSLLVIATQKAPLFFDVSANISNVNGSLKGYINAKSQKGSGEIKGRISYKNKADKIRCSLSTSGFNSQALGEIIPEAVIQDFLFEDLSLKLTYGYNLKTKKHDAHLKGTFINADIVHSAYWKAPLKFPHFSFEGLLEGHYFRIKEIATSIQGIPVKARTTGYINEKSSIISLKTYVDVADIPFKDLGKIWPKGAADGARDWIVGNITGGHASKAQVVMKSHLDFSGNGDFFSLDNLSGFIDINEALLSYVDTMPKVEGLMARANFDHEHFDIEIKSGKTHGLNVTSGKIFIGNFSDPTPRLELDINLVGDLGKVLSLIDHKPLEYAKDYGLNPKTARGETTANLMMSFPLSSPFDTKKIETKVKATVTNATLPHLVDLDVNLTKGNLNIDVGLTEVLVNGQALLNGEKSKIDLVKNLRTGTLDLKVNSKVTAHFLEPLWHEAGLFFDGSAPLILHYHINEKQHGTLDLNLNVRQTHINTLVMKKDIGIPGTLSLKGGYINGHLNRIDQLLFKDDQGWEIKGDAQFSTNHQNLKALTLNWNHNEKHILMAIYSPSKKGQKTLDIEAENIDLKTFMATDLSDLSDSKHLKEYPQDKKPFQINFKAQKITVGHEKGLLQNNLSLRLEEGLIQKLTYKGLTEEGIGKNRDVYAEIHKKADGTRKLRIQTEQGGAFLRALDLFDNIQGGQFKLVAHHDPAFRKDEWVGKIRVRNFALLKAPLLTRILSLLPTAGAELTGDSGMKLMLMKVHFGACPKAFTIHASRAHGFSLGFNLSGNIERGKEGRINLYGSMIPLYALNTLVSKIPLIGELISGGKNEGLLSVSFGVTGTKDKTEVSANPFSLITPGIMRNIFPSGGSTLTRDKGWVDESDHENDSFDQEFDTP